jgi:hypothetical protein
MAVIPAAAFISGALAILADPPEDMNTVGQSRSGGQRQTMVTLGRGALVITSRDAHEIKRALDHFLRDARHEIEKSVPVNLVPQVPERAWLAWIDENGTVRIDSWLLEPRGDELALTYRVGTPTATTFGYRFVAGLARRNRQWTVTSVGFEKLYPGRGRPRANSQP